MKKLIAALATLTLALPAAAKPVIVNPGELMVIVPGLEALGYSRISTVEHCSEIVGVQGDGWMDLITDSELEGMEACLIEHT